MIKLLLHNYSETECKILHNILYESVEKIKCPHNRAMCGKCDCYNVCADLFRTVIFLREKIGVYPDEFSGTYIVPKFE